VEMSAIALSNKVDYRQYPVREERYLAIIKQYTTLEDRLVFPAMLGELVIALDKTERCVLGPISAALGFCNFRAGQFWTPWEVSSMMARMLLAGNGPSFGNALSFGHAGVPPAERGAGVPPTKREGGGDTTDRDEILRDGGFMTAADPCCGPGGMILAFADAFKQEGLNPQTQLHFTAVDISPMCAHMAYVQCALWGIPAVVHLGDSLRMQFTSAWYTPAHILGGFSRKLRQRGIDESNAAWWVKISVPDRIAFLQQNKLEVSHALPDRPHRDVLDAKERTTALGETA
jgi:hypothetical protein